MVCLRMDCFGIPQFLLTKSEGQLDDWSSELTFRVASFKWDVMEALCPQFESNSIYRV